MMRQLGSLTLPLLMWGGALGLVLWRGDFASWFLFCCFGGAIVYALLVWMCTLHRVEVSRVVTGNRFAAGEEAQVTLTIRQRSWLPVAWMVVRDSWIREPGAKVYAHRKLLFPWFRAAFSYSYALRGLERGHYRARGLEISAGDLFGFVTKQKRIERPQSFVVYPHSRDVRQGTVSASGSASARETQAFHPAGDPQISGIRDYADGDPLSRIHWKSTARTGSLHTKLTEPAVSQDLFVVLDGGEGSVWPAEPDGRGIVPSDRRNGGENVYSPGGKGGRSVQPARPTLSAAFEACVEVAAGLLQYACRHQTGFGLMFIGARPATLPFSFQTPELEAGMELLAAVGPGAETVRAGQLPPELLLLPRQIAVVWVTPRLDESLAGQLGLLCEQGKHVLVLLVSSASVLSWQERQGKRQLESAGCAFHHVMCAPESGRPEAGVADVGA